jgi:hypothetical protein
LQVLNKTFHFLHLHERWFTNIERNHGGFVQSWVYSFCRQIRVNYFLLIRLNRKIR